MNNRETGGMYYVQYSGGEHPFWITRFFLSEAISVYEAFREIGIRSRILSFYPEGVPTEPSDDCWIHLPCMVFNHPSDNGEGWDIDTLGVPQRV